MELLWRRFLIVFIRRGSMVFTTASGEKFACGDGTGEPVFARFLTTGAQRRVLLNPELALGEIYMDGDFVIENGSIAEALAILLGHPDPVPSWAQPLWGLRFLVRHVGPLNPRDRSQHNVPHHYDLSG